MPTKTYYSVAGEIIAEETGGVRTDYITDALGSIVATVDSSQAVVNTYRYKPYGALLAKTGTGADPRFLWTGNTGSRTTNLNRAEQYNRARHYSSKLGQWISKDPLWPSEWAYAYVRGRVVSGIDPHGLLKLSHSAFIPKMLHGDFADGKNWLFEPLIPGTAASQYSTDNRGFGESGTSRIRTEYEVDTSNFGTPRKIKVSSSTKVDPTYKRVRYAAGWISPPMKAWAKLTRDDHWTNRLGPCSVEVCATASAGYPFVDFNQIPTWLRGMLGMPTEVNIWYKSCFVVTVQGRATFVRWRGWHTRFPAMEAIVEDPATGRKILLQKYSPTDRGPLPTNLGIKNTVGEYQSGVVHLKDPSVPRTC